MIYLLDTNVYIEAKNRYYQMSIFPGFWAWLEMGMASEQLLSICMVRDELLDNKDELAEWARSHKARFLTEDDRETQENFAAIAQHVMEHPVFAAQQKENFLSVADPWLIAKAKVLGATVVTQEALAPANSKKVKIPNVCRQFGVDYCNTFTLLSMLEAQFILRNQAS